jgi:hypothetical protein
VGVACLSRAHESVALSPIRSDGSFEIVAEGLGAGTYQAAVFAGAHAAWRRLLELGADTEEDLGSVDVRRAEYPAGLRGRLWDELGDHPLTAGRVWLRQGGRLIGETRAHYDGLFELEMSCERPLPPGEYMLEAEAAGYDRGTLPLHLVEQVTVYELGRLGLVREGQGADR